MATLELPTFDDEDYEYQIRLDGVYLTLTFRWNDRTEAWYLDIATEDGEPIASGRKIVIGASLFQRGVRDSDDRLPLGRLWAKDTSGAGVRPGRNDLGTRVKLYYDEQPSVE